MNIRKRDKYLFKRLGECFVAALIMTIPLIWVNESYFIDDLGWHSVALPLICVVGLWLGMLLTELKAKLTK